MAERTREREEEVEQEVDEEVEPEEVVPTTALEQRSGTITYGRVRAGDDERQAVAFKPFADTPDDGAYLYAEGRGKKTWTAALKLAGVVGITAIIALTVTVTAALVLSSTFIGARYLYNNNGLTPRLRRDDATDVEMSDRDENDDG